MNKNEKLVDKIIDELFYYDHETGIVRNKIHRGSKAKKEQISGWIHEGYICVEINSKQFKMHRIIWRLYYGYWPNGLIDHINGNKLDNKICNLREVTLRQNQQNRNVHRNGKLVGSSFIKKKKIFRSSIVLNKKQYHLGVYKTELEAHEQYLRALKAIETRKFKSAKELRDYLASTKK